MSREYDDYIKHHRENVQKAMDWFWTYLPNYYHQLTQQERLEIKQAHDASKFTPDEYEAYDAWFYGKDKSAAVKEAYENAWLRHIHRNPHHWQYWVLIHDDTEDGTEEIECLEMDYRYVIEMICDWWSFSLEKENLLEVMDWYKEHQHGLMFHPKTRKLVEEILGAIKAELERQAKGDKEELKNELRRD